jgi:predicted NUDIX family NTP pyrophosphohydrolase
LAASCRHSGNAPSGNAAARHYRRMPQKSAGILLYRLAASGPEVLLVHPGGPFWAKKDAGAWSIPKGLVEPGEDAPLAAARRELAEETNAAADGPAVALGSFRQPGGKIVEAWAVEGEFDLAGFRSNTFAMQWPPKSGRMAEFPEADRGGWFAIPEAREKILKGQLPILDALLEHLAGSR